MVYSRVNASASGQVHKLNFYSEQLANACATTLQAANLKRSLPCNLGYSTILRSHKFSLIVMQSCQSAGKSCKKFKKDLASPPHKGILLHPGSHAYYVCE